MSDTVTTAFITSGFALVGVLATLIVPRLHKNSRELKAQASTLETVREQVQNSHGTNLRDDIDRVLSGLHLLTAQVNDLRQDLAWERRERADVAARVTRLEGD